MAELGKDEDTLVAECSVCGGDILIEQDAEEDDVVYCNDCEAEYLIRSLDPLRLSPLDEDGEGEEGFGDDEDE